MKAAIEQANCALKFGAVPIGAVIEKDNEIIAQSYNEKKSSEEPIGNDAIPKCIAHAELLCVLAALKKIERLDGANLYVTLEPCSFCASLISLVRIENVIFGAYNTKYGGVVHGARVFDFSVHKPNYIGGVMETQCLVLLKKYFENKRF